MTELKDTICITGASGLVGRNLISLLKNTNIPIRILSRKHQPSIEGVECYKGSITDISTLKRFFHNATYIFHCAGELKNESEMYKINVQGTRNVCKAIEKEKVKYFCFLSSAGVVGKTNVKWIDEQCLCNPQNEYENTKLKAENIVVSEIYNVPTVVLRPINIVDETNPGVLSYPIRMSIKDKVQVYIKGNECAHLVHAKQVAEVATFFMERQFARPEIFFISLDSDPNNTVKNIWNYYCEITKKFNQKIKWSFPVNFPWILRKLRGRSSNLGDVKYSAEKLNSYGAGLGWSIQRLIDEIVGNSECLRENT